MGGTGFRQYSQGRALGGILGMEKEKDVKTFSSSDLDDGVNKCLYIRLGMGEGCRFGRGEGDKFILAQSEYL